MNLEREINIQDIWGEMHKGKHPLIAKRLSKVDTIVLESSFQSYYPVETEGCILPEVHLSEMAHSDPNLWCSHPYSSTHAVPGLEL